MEKLEEYHRKRDFEKTPEPAGDATDDAAPGCLYVMHKHAASHDHYDLRLEQDGVLRSWALPKGPSLQPGEKRLAVEVEDHPLEYGDFEGVIPQKTYGGGTSMLWDRGHWRMTGKAREDRLDFEIEGEKLHGSWTLTRMTGRNENGRNWLLIKRRDGQGSGRREGISDDVSVATGRSMAEIARDRDNVWTSQGATRRRSEPPDPSLMAGAEASSLSDETRPQLATLTREAPAGEAWLHEIKFDGYRIMVRLEAGQVRLITRNGNDWTERFPDLVAVLTQLPVDNALLDGEVVALAHDGTSSFRRIQEALSSNRTAGLVYQGFDLLHLEGYDLTGVPLVERKRALAQLLESAGFTGGSRVRYSDHIQAQGPAFFEQACRLGLEGIIAKRAGGTHESGRSKQWLKVKCAFHEEFVVGGYTRPSGARSGFGALLLGAFDADGELRYTSRVGTGFSVRQLESLHAALRELEVEESPFSDAVPDSKTAHWVAPEMVVEVEFTERTRDGRLRHPTFRGVREDRDPDEIRTSSASPMMDTGDSMTEDDSTSQHKPAGTSRARPPKAGEARVAGMRLTHPQRLLFPEQGITKLDLAYYYEEIQEWILPTLINRPLSLLRCPEGWREECFFQKHPRVAIASSVPRVSITEKSGEREYVYVQRIADLVGLVQAGALEIHPWGSRIHDVERPDLMVFDLDPAPEVGWKEILRVASELRERLAALGLESFVRTTGGKGLHLVVPLAPRADWDEVKAFARAVAQQHAQDSPRRITASMSKAKRQGRIFIDYLRNGRGATAIASYSVRAREGAPIAVPVRWDELNAALRADRYTLENLRWRLSALREDPWADFDTARQPITAEMRRRVGMK
ncbi:DNA ligase D [Halomonas shantousis]